MNLIKLQSYVTKGSSIAYYGNSEISKKDNTLVSQRNGKNVLNTPLLPPFNGEFNHRGYWGFNYLGSTRVAGRISHRDYPLSLRLGVGNSQISFK